MHHPVHVAIMITKKNQCEDDSDPNADNDNDDQGKYAGCPPVCDDEHDYQENEVKMTDILKLRNEDYDQGEYARCH